MDEDIERWIVTTDPTLLAKLWAKDDELDSFGMAEYAMSLGLFPPSYEEGQEHHSIEHVIPPGHEGPPLLVWSAGLWSPKPQDLYEEGDGGESAALWKSIGVGVVSASAVDGGDDGEAEPGNAPGGGESGGGEDESGGTSA